MTLDCTPPDVTDQDHSSPASNFSRRGFLLAGAAAGLMFPFVNSEGEAAVAGGFKPMRPIHSTTLIEEKTTMTLTRLLV